MAVVAPALFAFDNSFVRELDGLYERWQPAGSPAPELLVLNEDLARELGVDPETLRSPGGVSVLAGNAVPEGAEPVAQAYAGHQFGGYSPRLGDGRALLLGEVVDPQGRRSDLHMKGSGATPFARRGDGKAAIGPMLREYVIGEAMHALGIPTTRALAVVATGDRVIRETVLPGAILTRVAASHIRVGTFQYARATGDLDLLRRLTDHAIARHHPDAATPLEFYEAVLETQAGLVAQWMHVGFIHGVMNTDNMAVSGESIDFGPCAFMDFYEPATVFSSIDHGGRYAYGNQPSIAQWNLARFAEALLPLLADDVEAAAAKATEALQTFPDRFLGHWQRGMLAKLGLGSADEDEELVNDLLKTMHVQGDDYTGTFRTLARVARGEEEPKPAYAEWVARWRALAPDAAAMDRVNPVYIPRNHLVEDALTQATVGDLAPLHRLLDAITDPFAERPGLEAYAQPGPDEFGDRYVTFCGT